MAKRMTVRRYETGAVEVSLDGKTVGTVDFSGLIDGLEKNQAALLLYGAVQTANDSLSKGKPENGESPAQRAERMLAALEAAKEFSRFDKRAEPKVGVEALTEALKAQGLDEAVIAATIAALTSK